MGKKPNVSKYEEVPLDKKFEYPIRLDKFSRQDTVDTSVLQPPPPDTILWVALFAITLLAFVVGLAGLLTPHYMSGEIVVKPYKVAISGMLGLPDNFTVPDVLKMADFGLFSFCFSDEFLVIVRSAIAMGGGEVPENEGGMNLDFDKQCHKVIETENQPFIMKERTRIGKILMFMGLSSVFVTWLFVILVLSAGRHLSKVITGISASVSVAFLVSSLLVSMTLKSMTKDYLNLEIMKSVKKSVEELHMRVDVVEGMIGEKLEKFQPVDIVVGYSGFLIAASGCLMMVVGLAALFKTRSHKPG